MAAAIEINFSITAEKRIGSAAFRYTVIRLGRKPVSMRAYFRIYDQEILRLGLPSSSKASKAAGWTILVERIALITSCSQPGQFSRATKTFFVCSHSRSLQLLYTVGGN